MGHDRRPHGDHAMDRCSGDDHFPGVDVRVVGYVVIVHGNRSVDHDSQSDNSLRFDVDRRFVADRFGEDLLYCCDDLHFREDLLEDQGNRRVRGNLSGGRGGLHFGVSVLIGLGGRCFDSDSRVDDGVVIVRVNCCSRDGHLFDEGHMFDDGHLLPLFENDRGLDDGHRLGDDHRWNGTQRLNDDCTILLFGDDRRFHGDPWLNDGRSLDGDHRFGVSGTDCCYK
jgi:hypothetical protein